MKAEFAKHSLFLNSATADLHLTSLIFPLAIFSHHLLPTLLLLSRQCIKVCFREFDITVVLGAVPDYAVSQLL